MSTTPVTLPGPSIGAARVLAPTAAALPQPVRWRVRNGRTAPPVSPVVAPRREEQDAVVVKLLPLVRQVALEMHKHLPARVEVGGLGRGGCPGPSGRGA